MGDVYLCDTNIELAHICIINSMANCAIWVIIPRVMALRLVIARGKAECYYKSQRWSRVILSPKIAQFSYAIDC